MRIVKQLWLLVVLAVSAVAAAGCATGRAQVVEDSPALVVPPVPPRAIEAQPTVEPVEIEPIAPLPAAPSAPPKTRASAPRTSEPKPEAKPEAPPETTLPAATTTPPAVAPLRTATTPSGPDAERQIRDTMTRAQAILARVDYQKLSPDRRASYNAARNFVLQAEEKLKQDDLRLAMDFATRAEIAAKTLLDSGR